MATITKDGKIYELFENRPNWAYQPTWSLEWQRVVTSALRGNEDRADFKRVPKAVLEWTICPRTDAEWAAIQLQVENALLSGIAAVPLWTRPSLILQNDGTLIVQPGGLLWKGPHPNGGDHTYTAWCDGVVRGVTAYDAVTGELTLDGAVAATSAEIFAVVFGRLEIVQDDVQTSNRGDLGLRLLIPEWIVPNVPGATTVELTVVSSATGEVMTSSFYFSFTADAAPGLAVFDLTVDGELLPFPVYLYGPTAAAPEVGAVLLGFYADGVIRQAWGTAL